VVADGALGVVAVGAQVDEVGLGVGQQVLQLRILERGVIHGS
jgi:hypothetical protein